MISSDSIEDFSKKYKNSNLSDLSNSEFMAISSKTLIISFLENHAEDPLILMEFVNGFLELCVIKDS